LNNSAILGAIWYASSKNAYNNLYDTAVGLILAVARNIPGYWVSVAPIDVLALYQFISNFGVNSTTFIGKTDITAKA